MAYIMFPANGEMDVEMILGQKTQRRFVRFVGNLCEEGLAVSWVIYVEKVWPFLWELMWKSLVVSWGTDAEKVWLIYCCSFFL